MIYRGIFIKGLFSFIKGKTDLSAMAEVEQEFGFPVYSVVDVYDIIEYLEEDPANVENVARIRNYLAVNGAKV